MESALHSAYRQTAQIIFKDAEEKEALCQSVVRDGGLRQMFTDQVMLLHRKALVSRLAEKVYHMIINDEQKEISKIKTK